LAAENYSYHAEAYGARGAAASPLAAQLGALPLYRVEGHVGQPVTAVVAFLEKDIRDKNLPIALRSVLLGVDKTKIVVKPPAHLSDLHLVQHVVKQSIATQLQDLTEFTGSFRAEVDRAVDKGEITNPPNVDVISQIKAVALAKSNSVSEKAGLAMQKLAAKEPSWANDVNDAITSAAQFKMELGGFTKTQFLAPVDALIAVPHAPWLDWIGGLLDSKDDQAAEQLLFSRFVKSHPGVEHCAGVLRGGTFVLVYDEAGVVVADFMLPYYLETPEPDIEVPPLKPPSVKPGWTLQTAIQVKPPLERLLGDKIDVVRTQVEKHGTFFEVFKNPIPSGAGAGGVVVGPKAGVQDLVLEGLLLDIQTTQQSLDHLRNKVLDPALDPAAVEAVNVQIEAAETNLAQAAAETSKYVASQGLEVTRGTDGYVALAKVTQTVSQLRNESALTVAKTGLTSAAGAATNPDTKTVLGNIARVRGF
jgi:hypothetical protein